MQIGLGQLRFSPSVFYDMTFDEFLHAARGMNEQEEMRQRQEWERTRWAAAIALAPHSKKGTNVKPSDLCTFPWEEEKKKKGQNILLANTLKSIANG